VQCCFETGRSFRALCYTADGQHLLAAGHSKSICIYSVEHQILCKKFDVTCNLSFDGTLVSASILGVEFSCLNCLRVFALVSQITKITSKMCVSECRLHSLMHIFKVIFVSLVASCS